MIKTFGQYKILEVVEQRRLGDVYRARDTQVGRTVAITVVSDSIATDPDRRGSFLHEARAAAAVSHPNIVTFYEVGDNDDCLYLVHEFIQGQTLKGVIGGRPINPRRAVDLASQIAEGLANAHAADLVHGHIIVETIVIAPKGNAKITDLGLGDGRRRRRLPQSGPLPTIGRISRRLARFCSRCLPAEVRLQAPVCRARSADLCLARSIQLSPGLSA